MNRSVSAGACLLAVTAIGQDRPQAPVFETRITLVEVEVSVLDRNRRPLRGLTAADFTLLEEGTPQQIQTFADIELPPPPATPWMREVASDVRGNAPREGRLIAIVLDDGQLTLRMVPKAKQMARRLIGELSPGDLAAVIFSRDNSRSQEFTEDPQRLIAAVDSLHPGVAGAPMPPPPQPRGAMVYIPTPDTGDVSPGIAMQRSVGVLSRVAAAVGEAPKRRKAIFYIGPGVPLDPAARAATGTAIREGHAEIIREAQLGNVTIYALDPGLQDLSSALPTLRREFLQGVAEQSGGFVVGERDDLEAGVAQIFQETGAYYLLGYQSPRTEADGRVRAIEVKVGRPGVTVRARGGFRAPRRKPAPTTTLDPIAEALPKPGIRMQAFAAPFAGAGRAGPTLALIVGVRRPAPGAGARVQEELQLQVSAYAPEGKLRASRRSSYAFGLLSAGAEVAYELVSRLDVPPGSYQLRISTSSEAQRESGSVYYDVEVPDFSKRALSLSGLLMSAAPAPVQIGEEQLSALLPVRPTSLREFSADTKLTAFARVYQRAKSPRDIGVVLTLLDGRGVRVFRANESLATSRFSADGAADYQRELPLAGLEPGPYLLTLEARSDARTSAARSARFLVVP